MCEEQSAKQQYYYITPSTLFKAMKCRYCKRNIPDNSIFCNWCGKEQKKDKEKISVPKPRRNKDGTFSAQIMIDGNRVRVKGETEAKYYAAATAYKTGMMEVKQQPAKITLEQACQNYIDKRSAVLSPSTICGYNDIKRNRFKGYMSKDIRSIDYQAMINAEAAEKSPKTVKNAWTFIASVLRQNDVDIPKISLPQIVKKDLPWLDDGQIKVLLKAIEGNPQEIGILLGLHGLRKSEILAISPSKIIDNVIHVEGSIVNTDNGMVEKDTNKNTSSRRTIPIMIPRLKQLIQDRDCPSEQPYVSGTGQSMYEQINKVCAENNLPAIGVHGLRRSFVSLAYSLGWSERECMLYGGWADYQTMHNIYIKLSNADKVQAAQTMEDFYKIT